MQWNIAFASLIVGWVIGLTGMGGGALMTPMLVIFFHVTPSAAISSDVVASFVLKPIGGGVHIKARTVNWTLVRWLSIGSVPFAFLGAYFIDDVASKGFESRVKEILGAVLLVAAIAMVVKIAVQARRHQPIDVRLAPNLVRPLPTILIGAAGGFIVGMTSVGSGSLMIVMLLLAVPHARLTRDGRHRLGAGDPARRARPHSVTCSSGTSSSTSPPRCSSVRSRACTWARGSRPRPAIATFALRSPAC